MQKPPTTHLALEFEEAVEERLGEIYVALSKDDSLRHFEELRTSGLEKLQKHLEEQREANKIDSDGIKTAMGQLRDGIDSLYDALIDLA